MQLSASSHLRSLAAAFRAAFGHGDQAGGPGPRPTGPTTSPRPGWKQLAFRKTTREVTVTIQPGRVSIDFGWSLAISDETLREYLSTINSDHGQGFFFTLNRAKLVHGTALITLTPEHAAGMVGFLVTHYGIRINPVAILREPSLIRAFLQGAYAHARFS